ncbi:hypothetical protein PCANC_21987 [Puccinia coronata f. sp. avenae]|uniref:Uncharacterized protein n=1 Tax=Puccinia coronata f. sp. avenae TaxID=200324 RepID=A0A2N5SDK3_9BASI|nr:hypothetical protein PCANC_23066 [Puccinia coronata f. sp. avenae]PLW23425.1 hypothetical protein PCASD_14719 [Puccinia coronata f. sp. avenae]PLW31976.1 hypothetical protein PCANC_21987 [Puccinia coronata f. sp. avenae]PLW37655.1 hypothetical protein PCASD_12184 [Puccinia coronata f. sp. avenae]
MPQTPPENSSIISIASDSPQPSLSSPLDQDRGSPVSELAELSCKEIQALKQYSHSVQNFTYQLFENFRLELAAKGRPSPSVNIVDPSGSPPSNSKSSKSDHIGFRSTDLIIDNSSSPPFDNLSQPQPNNCSTRRKPSDLPRRKKYPGPDFPEGTGL